MPLKCLSGGSHAHGPIKRVKESTSAIVPAIAKCVVCSSGFFDRFLANFNYLGKCGQWMILPSILEAVIYTALLTPFIVCRLPYKSRLHKYIDKIDKRELTKTCIIPTPT